MRQLAFPAYLDKVHGAWIGKSLGGTIGRFEGTKEITHLNIFELLPKDLVPNDDLDVQLVWLDVLLDQGIHFTSSQLMEAWIRQYDYNFGEYGFGRRNFLRGLHPPTSGYYANAYYKTGMGCPIRSDVWGLICPGAPDLAAEYAYRDGILDHEGESVWAEQMLAAMSAEAFFEHDLSALIEVGMRYAPPASRLYHCIQDVRTAHAQGLAWQQVWRLLRDRHSHPDCTYAPFNLGVIVMALLYGRGDLEETLTIAVNSGWDVDCTCSSTAALLGLISGRQGFEKRWLDYVGDRVATMARLSHPMETLTQVTEHTCRTGLTLFREGLLTIDLLDAPDHVDSVPTRRYVPEVDIQVDYCGYPAIGVGEPKSLGLRVTNHGIRTRQGELALELPEGWQGGEQSVPLTLEPGSWLHVDWNLEAPPSVGLLHDTNVLNASFRDADGEVSRCSFGLCGAPVSRVLGPFFDAYDRWLDHETLPERRFLRTPSQTIVLPEIGEEWGNHRVDLDTAYIDEDFTDPSRVRARFAEGLRVSTFDDRYVVSDVLGLQGSCCVYYYQELHSPIARTAQFFIGSTDPAMIWLNGELCLRQDCHRFWFCNNDVVDIALRQGLNTLVFKVLRVGADNCLSLAVRHTPTLGGYDSAPFVTDLAWGTL
ncbi:MAG: ADP-ribosylglycohydrolase family protein [Anaerolineae bacterium]